MKKIKGKKGVEITLNTIIIAIIVVLVLVVVVAFFVGSFTNLAQKIGGTLFGTTSGYSRTLAVSNCRNYCQQSNYLPKGTRDKGPYCATTQSVDINDDGEADTELFAVEGEEEKETIISYYCHDDVDSYRDDRPTASLSVPCINSATGSQLDCSEDSTD